jgi:anti-sigma factor ChrR (cupin superfamily)
MISVVRDAASPADEPGAFDRKVAEVLQAEARMVREKSERLLATGSVSVNRPAGVLNASLRPPRWWRPGVLREWAVKEDGHTSASVVPLGRTMDGASVLSEITLQLAVSVAWLDE